MLDNSGFRVSLHASAHGLRRSMLLGALLLASGLLASAQGHGINNPELFDSVLHYHTEEVTLPHQLQVQPAASLRFLNGEDANHVIYDVWGGSADPSILGMLLPRNLSPVSEGGWGLSLQHLDTGYVDARRWKNVQAQDVLKKLQDTSSQVQVLGWAMPPTFDPRTGLLIYAAEVKLPGAESTAVFPRVLLLGREGLVLMKGIIEKKHWEGLKKELQNLGHSVQFTAGHRYTDVQAGDRLYDYGMSALITEQPIQDPEKAPFRFPWMVLLMGMGLMVVLLGKRVRSRNLTLQAE
ncbi:DUF2167 domain-containing protein [Deinococcus roseus]|nr:DUF2167 domain-containing protein [Deinococcus roseus]